MDFTTEGPQYHGGGDRYAPHGTREGTSLIEREGGMSFRLERNIVGDLAAHRAGAHVGRGPFRNRGFNIATVAGQPVLAAVAEVANLVDAPTGRNHLHQ